MSVITAYPAPLAPSISSPSSGTKRKRSTSLHVRFCSEAPQVEYTYSQSDYDRSGLFPTVTAEDIQKIYTNPVIVAVSINMITPAPPAATAMPPLKRTKQQRPPRLSIDTSKIHGPLFFTNMTTNHQKKTLPPMTPVDNDDQDEQTRENTKHNV
ncbi:hypothetical protein BJV82DRAFT_625127 [Fennellomyces sp. T-0311]|nr:hypothetical protein BJV82DRAFT_625127 [Fennellomyces sp. T-0311]